MDIMLISKQRSNSIILYKKKMIKRIKKYLIFLWIIRRLAKKDHRRPFPLSLRTKLRAWSSGYLPESMVIYEMDKYGRDAYLSDFDRARAATINGPGSVVLDYKHVFAHAFNDERRVVQPEFCIVNGTPYSSVTGEPIRPVEFLQLLKEAEFVFKPSAGGGGAGISFTDFKAGIYLINGRECPSDEFLLSLARMNHVVVYKKIEQTGFAKAIYPGSLNTIRILTMLDVETCQAFIATAVFRCGVQKSGPVDNWSSGGLSAKVDVDTGTIGKGVAFPVDGRLKWMSHHPESGVRIEGTRIPNWELISKDILRIAQRCYFVPYIAWDVVPMEDDFLILEGNSNSDVNLLQVHGPLFTNHRVKRFFEHYGII